MLIRLSIPDTPAYAKVIEQQGVVPEPVYGGQFQDMAVPGVTPEGKVRVDYTSVNVTFKDGTERTLTWAPPSRRESWTDEMRAAARENFMKGEQHG